MNINELMEMLEDVKSDLKEEINKSKENYKSTCKNNPTLMTIQNIITLKEDEAKLKMVQQIMDKIKIRIKEE